MQTRLELDCIIIKLGEAQGNPLDTQTWNRILLLRFLLDTFECYQRFPEHYLDLDERSSGFRAAKCLVQCLVNQLSVLLAIRSPMMLRCCRDGILERISSS